MGVSDGDHSTLAAAAEQHPDHQGECKPPLAPLWLPPAQTLSRTPEHDGLSGDAAAGCF